MAYEIRLDALSIRQEVEDMAEFGAIDEATVEYVNNLSDEEIGDSIRATVGDGFWGIYDTTRARIIDHILAQK